MKRLLISSAALLACGAASAQSSVTLFGIVDVNVGYVSKDNSVDPNTGFYRGRSRTGLGAHGRSTSRLGFRGMEDLGGGLKAGFWLEGEVNPDTGGASFNFRRRSVVRLAGDFGEFRMGRDLVPSYSALGGYDIWESTGIAHFMALTNKWNSSAQGPDDTGVRADNLLLWTSPNMNGFSGSVGYAFDEKRATVGNSNKIGRYVGGYVRYASGPLSVSLTGAQQKTGIGSTPANRDAFGVGGSYDFGPVKLGGILTQIAYKPDGLKKLKYNSYALNAAIPVGGTMGRVGVSYALYDQKAIDSKTHHFAVGYDHYLSKRTTLYGIVAGLKNNDAASMGLSARNVYTDGVPADKSQSGIQVGIRHTF